MAASSGHIASPAVHATSPAAPKPPVPWSRSRIGLERRRAFDVQQQRELVATDASGDVAGAETLAQLLADLAQHGVATLMADAVVDGLESVEVDDHETEAPPVAHASTDGGGQVLVEPAAVVQAGERIVQRLVVQPVET